MKYFASYNGLYFSFDGAERFNNGNDLVFTKNCVHSDNGSRDDICSIDLSELSLVFNFKGNGTCYFNIVPVGGASGGK